MITRLRYPKGYQFFDANGAPLALGTLTYYAAGTTTLQNTYSDSAGTVGNTNPLVLDGSGRLDVDVYLGSAAGYKEVLATASATVSPWPDDNIPLASQADWTATSGPNQILNKPTLAAVATSGSYTDLSNTPAAFTGDGGSGGTGGLVPAPVAGDAVANKFLSAAGGWTVPPAVSGAAATNLSITETATSVGIGSSSGTGITIPAATSTGAGALDAARAAKIDGLAVVATSGSYTDLLNKPANMSGAGSSTAGQAGFVPAPAAGQNGLFLRGDAAWATPTGTTNLSGSQTASSVSIASSTGAGVTIGAATATAAGVLDSARASKVDGLATVAATGSYADLTGKPSIPSIPSSLSAQNIDNIARLGINTTDTGNLLSVNAPSALFSSASEMRATISKGTTSNTAAINLQDNFSTRAQLGLLGNDSFTIAASSDGSTFKNAIVATTAGAVSFPNTGGFTGDSGSGGTSGLVPASAAGTAAAGKFLKADGTWSVPPGTATVMAGASALTAGSSGLAPAPSSGQQGSFLRGDGTWQQMSAAQVSGLSPSATLDTTNASNITNGTLAANRVGDLSSTYVPNNLKGANNGVATLDAGGKLTASQIPASLTGAVVYQGTWNANTNTPALASGAGTKGYYYKVSAAGTTAIDGISQWNVGDTIIFDGTTWDKIDGVSNEVVSVAGLYGAISASGLKSALAITSTDVSGLGGLATQSTVNLSSQVTGSLPYSSLSAPPTLGALASLSSVNNSNWSGPPLSIANGGTGQTVASAAFNALSPMTAAGDVIYGGASGAGTRLPAGTSNQVLIGGATPSWGAVNLGSMVTGSLPAASVSGLGTLATQSTGNFGGDGGSGGTAGFVPAPAAGDTAGGKFLSAGGGWAVPPVGTPNLTSAASGSYSVALNATANTILTLPKEGTLASIPAAKTYSINHDGSGNFSDLRSALSSLIYNDPVNGVNLNLDAGTHNYSSLVYIGRNQFKGVWINGATPISTSLTSVASSSGSAGAWSLTLNVASTAGINTGMYAAVYGASGGTNPTYVEGLFPITAVGTGTITVSTAHRYSVAPSGAVTATVAVLSTILKFTGCDGFDIWDGASALNMGNVAIVGDGTAGKIGLNVQDLGRLNTGGVVGVCGFGGYNVYANLNAEINGATLVCSSSNSIGIYADTGARLEFYGEIVSSGNASTGAVASGCSFIRGNGNNNTISGLCSTGNGGDGVFIDKNSVVDATVWARATGNAGYGFHTAGGGRFGQWVAGDGQNGSGDLGASFPLNKGTLLSTPAAGSLEYDGQAPYFSPVAGVRGVVPAYQYSKVTASGGISIANDTSAHSFLPSGAQNFPVQAGVLYRFRARIPLSVPVTNSCSKSFLFATGGGAAFSWIAYRTITEQGTSQNGSNGTSSYVVNVATATAISVSSSASWFYADVEGDFVMSGAGTIQPQVQFSAAPGGTSTVLQGAYFELYSYGANSASAGTS